MRYAVLLAVLLALSGCGPRMTGATERSITFDGMRTTMFDDMAVATAEAERHCATYGRKARLQSVTGRRAIFHCVD